MKGIHSPFVRNFRSGDLFEAFLVTAAVTILMVRGYLALTGYPQLGNDVLHIAHVLPGGLLMVAAIVLTLGFLNKEARAIAAVAGGIGFGLFIDELGKFLTKDVNYFFEPTVALIYVTFVVLFLIFRWIEERRATEQEYVINAIEAIKEVALHDLDRAERKMALAYLKHGSRNDPAVRKLRELLGDIKPASDEEPGFLVRCYRRLGREYRKLVRRPWFNRAVITLFVAGSVISLGWAVFHILDRADHVTFSEWGELLSTAAAGILVLLGAFRLVRGQRLAAYVMFQRSVLVYLLVTQFFVFYREQFAGLAGLIWALIVLVVLQYAIRQERYGG